MAQNAFYILDANPPAVQAVGGSLDSDTAPGGQTHAQPAFGFATHNIHGANVSRSLETSTYNRISHQRSRSLVPLYFDPDAHVGGLVCGLQGNTKNLVLTNILHSSLVSTESQSPAGVICFTAQNGSRNIVSAVASLPESISKDTQIIILTPPRNVSKMRAMHHGSARTSVYPLIIHEEDIQVEHLVHLTAGESLDSAAGPSPEVLGNFRTAEAKFSYSEFIGKPGKDVAGQDDLVDHISRPLAKRGHKNLPPLPEWVEWLKEGQKPLVSGSTGVYSHASPDATNQSSHLILCIDWTGLFPQEQRLMSVLGDIVLTYWVKHCQVKARSGNAIRTLVVCDQAQDYLYHASPGPFIRKLLQLVAVSAPTVTQRNATDSTNEAPKYQQTINSSLVLLAETPIRLPADLLDHLSFLIIHRFTSPSWLKSLEDHFFLPLSREGREGTTQSSNDASQEATSNSSYNMLQILTLAQNEVLIFAPRSSKSNARTSVTAVHTNGGTIDLASGTKTTNNITINTNAVAKKGLDHQWIKIKLSNGQDGQDIYDGSGTPISTPRDIAFPTSATSSGSMNSTSAFNMSADPILNPSLLRRGPSPNPNSFNAMPPKSSHTAYTAHTSTSPQRSWGLGALTPTTNSSGSIPMPTPATSLLSPPTDSSMRAHGVGSIGSFVSSAGVIAPPTRPSPPSPGPRSLSTNSNSGSVAYSSQYALSPSSPVGISTNGFSPFITSRSFAGASGGHADSVFASSYSAIVSGGGGYSGTGPPAGYVEVRPMGNNSTNGARAFPFNGLSRSPYADATTSTATREGEERRETAMSGVDEQYNLQFGSVGTSGLTTGSNVPGMPRPEGLGLDSSGQMGPSPPPIYPESFFWPLLDALERARGQVSTPHNRAQSVRHSVVGQELPQAARQRLQLTFKEYVAAAARAGVVVTGDSGDKAWIALKEWKYPGKNASSHSVRTNPR